MGYVKTRRVDRNGRIVLTRELLELLGAGPGQAVEFFPAPEGILIRKAAKGPPAGAGRSHAKGLKNT